MMEDKSIEENLRESDETFKNAPLIMKIIGYAMIIFAVPFIMIISLSLKIWEKIKNER